MALHALAITRICVLSLTLIFGITILGIGAHFLSFALPAGVYLPFTGLAVAVGCLTLITLPVFLVVGLLRKGAFLTRIVVEIPVLAFLSVMFLTNGAVTASAQLFTGGCENASSCLSCLDIYDAANPPNPAVETNEFCNQYFAIIGLSIVNWIILMTYTIVLAVYSWIASKRGQKVWTSSVNATEFFASSATTNTGMVERGPPGDKYVEI